MGGKIQCRSTPGVGTEFDFTLKVASMDSGLTHNEEIKHQFQIAKLVENNLNQVVQGQSNPEEDRAAEVTAMESKKVEDTNPLSVPVVRGSKMLQFVPLMKEE